MVFLKHNLLVRVVITFVIFYWKVNGDCMELLKKDGFDKRTGFQNLASKVANLEVEDEYTDFNVPIEYKLQVEKVIENYNVLPEHFSDYGLSYVHHLLDLVKRPEQMQPPEIWCKIFECLEEYLESDTPFDEYINYASIKINTNSPAIRFCFIKTCHDTLVKPRDIIINQTSNPNDQKTNGGIKLFKDGYNKCECGEILKQSNKKNDQKTKEAIKSFMGNTGFQDLFIKTYRTHKRQFYRRSPLTWCTIQACYNSILEKGFDNVPAKFNISSVAVLSSEDQNTYVADFSKFLHPTNPTLVTKKRNVISSVFIKKKKNTSVPVNNNFSSLKPNYMYELYEYPINWCAVKICHEDMQTQQENDLINAGFTFKTFRENYDVLPKIKQALENNIGKRIVEIINKIIYLLFGNTIEYYSTEYIYKYIWNLGAIIGKYLRKYTKRLVVHLMNSYLGEFFGIKAKQYFLKKCENEDPSLYFQLLFEIEKLLLIDERYKIYQSEFVPKYCFHLEKLVRTASGDTNENYIPADREKRTPFEWCMFTVVHETLQL